MWKIFSIGTISAIKRGAYYRPCCPDRGDNGAESPRTIEALSMECFGFFELEHHGGICRRSMESGELFISAFGDGGIRAYGRESLKH